MVPSLFVAALALQAPVPKDTANADALKALSGEWVVTSSQEFGKKGELHVGDVFKFDGERLTHEGHGDPVEYRIRLTASAKPSQMDWRFAEPADAATSHRGIFKLDDGKLTVCVVHKFDADDPTDRPTEFETKAGRSKGDAPGSVMLVLERKRK